MRKARWLAAIVLPLFLVSFLQSQSLADLAKREKARRAALKGRTATVITTADIARVKKRPAVEVTGQEQAAAAGTEAAQTEGQAQEGVTPPAGAEQAQAAAAQAATAEAAAVKPAETDKTQEAPPAGP